MFGNIPMEFVSRPRPHAAMRPRSATRPVVSTIDVNALEGHIQQCVIALQRVIGKSRHDVGTQTSDAFSDLLHTQALITPQLSPPLIPPRLSSPLLPPRLSPPLIPPRLSTPQTPPSISHPLASLPSLLPLSDPPLPPTRDALMDELRKRILDRQALNLTISSLGV
jgi:hypothetical protein